jgi:putative transposase
MPRPPRPTSPNLLFHVINRGNNKQRIFITDEDYSAFLHLMKLHKHRFGLKIYFYVLMPNHIHLLVEPLYENTLSQFMHAITLGYSKMFKEKYKCVGHLWQGRFKSLLIESDEYLLQCGIYIEHNPVRAKLALLPSEYNWSSYNEHNGHSLDPISDFHPFISVPGT